jgi:hypothetical protein
MMINPNISSALLVSNIISIAETNGSVILDEKNSKGDVSFTSIWNNRENVVASKIL